MAIIYSYPEIPDVQGGDLLLISDTGAPNKPTRSVDIDDLATYIGTVIGIGFWNLGTAPNSIFTTKMASIGQDANVSNSKLNVYKTDDMTASVPHVATFNESSSNHSANLWPSTGSNQADIYASVSRGTFTGSGTVDQIIGSNPIGRHSGSGSVNFIQGVQATASLTGSGSAKTMVASYANAFIEGTGSNNIEYAIGAWNMVELNGLNDVGTMYGTYSNLELTNGEVNDDAIGHYINFQQVAADTEINNAYYIHAKNDSLSVTGEKFFIKDETGIPSQFSNKLVLNAYGSGAFTGTATQRLAVDTNGNVIEIPIGSGPVDGSGTANYTARWIDTDTLGIGALYDNGTNVGIGTTNPTQKLEVNGTVLFSTLPGNNGRLCLGDVSTSLFSNAASGHLYIITNNSSRMTILDNGNVGIGTTSPGAKLEVEGRVDFSNDLRLRGTDSSANQGVSRFYVDSSNKLYIDTANDGSNMFVIDSSGNVGIGTTSPTKKLHVFGGAAAIEIDSTTNEASLKYDNSTTTAAIKLANNDLKTELGGSEKMRILANGNVGIGTTSPSEKLEVAGNARITGDVTLSNGNALRWTSDDVRIEATTASDNMKFYVGNTEVLKLEQANLAATFAGDITFGAYGAGTLVTDASGNVSVSSGGGAGGPYLPLAGGTMTGTNGVVFPDNFNLKIGTNSDLQIYHDGSNSYIKDAGAGSLKILAQDFDLKNAADTASMIRAIDGAQVELYYGGSKKFETTSTGVTVTGNGIFTGNVGIGTTSPSEKLQVDGAVKFGQNSNIPQAAISHHTNGYLYIKGGSSGLAIGNDDYNANMYLTNGNAVQISTSGSDRMIINSSGNVGIGTTSPDAKLDVNGGLNSTHAIFSGQDGRGLKISTENTLNNDDGVVYDAQTSTGQHLFKVSGGEKMRIISNGNVGIGTTSPGAKLSVNGNVKIEGTNSLLFGGSASIPSWAINHNGSDLLIDDQGGNIGSVLFNNSEGVALPRLTTTQINAISLPAQGLMAYNTTLNTICFYNGSSWQKVSHTNM